MLKDCFVNFWMLEERRSAPENDCPSYETLAPSGNRHFARPPSLVQGCIEVF